MIELPKFFEICFPLTSTPNNVKIDQKLNNLPYYQSEQKSEKFSVRFQRLDFVQLDFYVYNNQKMIELEFMNQFLKIACYLYT